MWCVTLLSLPSLSTNSRQGTAEVTRPGTALSTLSSYLPGNAESEGWLVEDAMYIRSDLCMTSPSEGMYHNRLKHSISSLPHFFLFLSLLPPLPCLPPVLHSR